MAVTNVVLDTNALMMPFQFNVDLEAELGRLLGAVDIFVPDVCLEELTLIKDKRSAAAMELANRFTVKETVGKSGDDAVLALAGELRAVLVTNDSELRRRAKAAGMRVAYLRGKDHLALE